MPYIDDSLTAKEPYVSIKEPYISTKMSCIGDTIKHKYGFYHSSIWFAPKSNTYPQTCPTYIGNSFPLQKSPSMYIHVRNRGVIESTFVFDSKKQLCVCVRNRRVIEQMWILHKCGSYPSSITHTHTTVYTTKHKCGSDPTSVTHTHTQLFPAVCSIKNFVDMKIKMCLLSFSLSRALSFSHTHKLFPAVGSKKSSVDTKIRMCPLSL